MRLRREELGVELFVPSGRGVKLPPPAEAFSRGSRHAWSRRTALAIENARTTAQAVEVAAQSYRLEEAKELNKSRAARRKAK